MKGQSAIEFVILIMAILFLFVGMLYFIQGKVADKQYDAVSALVNEVALTIQDEVNLAHSSANGYFRQFTIPLNINGFEYSVELVENLVYVKTEDTRHAVAIPILNVTGQVFIGANSIYKVNSSVYLN